MYLYFVLKRIAYLPWHLFDRKIDGDNDVGARTNAVLVRQRKIKMD